MQVDLQADMMVEIAYALPHTQSIIAIKVQIGITAETAIKTSGILEKFPEINLAHQHIGIFGKVIRLNTILNPMDRVEIYRPLIANPKELRRQRVALGRLKK